MSERTDSKLTDEDIRTVGVGAADPKAALEDDVDDTDADDVDDTDDSDADDSDADDDAVDEGGDADTTDTA